MIGNLDKVTAETVRAAACTFILLGMVFASVVGLIYIALLVGAIVGSYSAKLADRR